MHIPTSPSSHLPHPPSSRLSWQKSIFKMLCRPFCQTTSPRPRLPPTPPPPPPLGPPPLSFAILEPSTCSHAWKTSSKPRALRAINNDIELTSQGATCVSSKFRADYIISSLAAASEGTWHCWAEQSRRHSDGSHARVAVELQSGWGWVGIGLFEMHRGHAYQSEWGSAVAGIERGWDWGGGGGGGVVMCLQASCWQVNMECQ